MCVVSTNSSSFVTHGSLRRSAAGRQATGAQPRRRSHFHAVAVCVVAGTKPPGSASATSSWSRQLRSSPALPSPTMLGTAALLGETCSAHVHEPCSLQAIIRVATRAVWRALCVALLHGCVQHVSGYYGVWYRSHAVHSGISGTWPRWPHACMLRRTLCCMQSTQSRFHRNRLALRRNSAHRQHPSRLAGTRTASRCPRQCMSPTEKMLCGPPFYAPNPRPPYRSPTTEHRHARAHTKLLL